MSGEIICWADLETASECDLRQCGTAAYAEHETTRIQLFAYAFDCGPVKVWNMEEGQSMPLDLRKAFASQEVIFWFHNTWFDRNVIERVLGIHLPIERYRCSMALALSHGLPANLNDLGIVLGLPEDMLKIKDGRRLVLKFCKPKKTKEGGLKWSTFKTDPEDWAKYVAYAGNDVIAMRECVARIPKWNYPYSDFERRLWFLDQTVNNRGMGIDLELVNAALTAIDREQKFLAKSTVEMTQGEVETAGQRDLLLKHISATYGIDLPNMQKATLESLVDNDGTPSALRDLLSVRLSACTTSTAKYKRILQTVNADGRIRGSIQFAGAAKTLRDAGRLIQIQNFPSRGLMSPEHTRLGILALKAGMAEIVGADIMRLTSSCLRQVITAKPGHKLLIADLSAIEGRIVAWLAKEEWKVQAFRDFDAGTGPDIYVAAYAKAFGVDTGQVTKAQRNSIGKIQELALGYQGGVGAIIAFATSFGLEIPDLAEQLRPFVPDNILADSESFYDWMKERDKANSTGEAKKMAAAYKKLLSGNTAESRGALKAMGVPKSAEELAEAKLTHRFSKEVYAPLNGLKRIWRNSHPRIVKLWEDVEEACKSAVLYPRVSFPFGNNCIARRDKNWVRIILPSRHSIPYPSMQIDEKGALSYLGINQFTKKWTRIYTHGGKLVENMTQALARDVFKYGALLVEEAGYPIILPLHDELVVEVPDTKTYTVKRLEELMSAVPPWAEGLPLSAKGFEDYCYHKDYD